MKDNYMHSNGTTAHETLSLIIPSIFNVFITTTFVTLIYVNKKLQILLECVMLLIPLVLNITVLSSYVYSVLTSVIITLLLLLLLVNKYFYNVSRKLIVSSEKRIPFITNARATINVISIIAILAVDFKVFPRKFAKTATFGFSLMDTGVGLYIFANSIVSPECLNKKDSVMKIIKSCTPLFILGMVRLGVTAKMDYHVPITEYGIHWNFFFTLLFTKCFGSLIIKTAHVKHMRTFSILVLCLHEILLQCFLQDIVMNNEPRNNFFLANKEGMSSILGYTSLYLFAVYFGHILNDKVYGSLEVKKNFKMFLAYLTVTGISTYFLNGTFGTSRRLINSSYCTWAVFVGISAALLFYLGELLQTYAFGINSNYIKAPYIFEAINFNALIFFLLGNVFTGIINVLCDTFTVSNTTAILILLLYILILTVIMCVLYEKKIKLKI